LDYSCRRFLLSFRIQTLNYFSHYNEVNFTLMCKCHSTFGSFQKFCSICAMGLSNVFHDAKLLLLLVNEK
jgi:hypothetical protein